MACLSFVQLGNNTINVSGSRHHRNVVDQYARKEDGTPYNLSPFIMPFDATLVTITAATRENATWKAQVRSNGIAVNGAELQLNATKSGLIDINIQFFKNQSVEIYLESNGIPYPSVNLIFQQNI